jgi:hypothetical protein
MKNKKIRKVLQISFFLALSTAVSFVESITNFYQVQWPFLQWIDSSNSVFYLHLQEPTCKDGLTSSMEGPAKPRLVF